MWQCAHRWFTWWSECCVMAPSCQEALGVTDTGSSLHIPCTRWPYRGDHCSRTRPADGWCLDPSDEKGSSPLSESRFYKGKREKRALTIWRFVGDNSDVTTRGGCVPESAPRVGFTAHWLFFSCQSVCAAVTWWCSSQQHNKKVLSLIPGWGLTVWSLFVLPASLWLPSEDYLLTSPKRCITGYLGILNCL